MRAMCIIVWERMPCVWASFRALGVFLCARMRVCHVCAMCSVHDADAVTRASAVVLVEAGRSCVHGYARKAYVL